jgi:RNA polymerase sigma-70 factor (ECF subfamily)
LNYCTYVTRDHAAGEEIVQETFLRLINQKEHLSELSSLKDWLFICARNLCFNHLKAGKRMANYPESCEELMAENSDEMSHFIQMVLDKLTAEERDLILMREQQQYSITEIASHLSASEEAIRVRLYRVRKKMQQFGKEYR